MTLAELVAGVAQGHVQVKGWSVRSWPSCRLCRGQWPCDAARLAALLTPESVAAAIRRAPVMDTDEDYAAALLAAIAEADR